MDSLLNAFLEDGLVEFRKGTVLMSDNPDVDDINFFKQHPDRKAHIRLPGKTRFIDKQRAMHMLDECEAEFRSLGTHDVDRRRIILSRSDHRGNLLPERKSMKIPFLLFSDETVEDRDDILLPIIFEMMAQQSKQYTSP